MDLGKLSKQLEMLPASGLTLELKHTVFFGPQRTIHFFSMSSILMSVYFLFFLFIVISPFLLPLALWQSILIAFISVGYGQNLFRKYLLLSHPASIKKIVFTELGWCYVQLNDSNVFKADIIRNTILTEHLIILNMIEQPGQESLSSSIGLKIQNLISSNQHSIFLTRDQLGATQFRDIKCHLRFISFIKKEDDLEK